MMYRSNCKGSRPAAVPPENRRGPHSDGAIVLATLAAMSGAICGFLLAGHIGMAAVSISSVLAGMAAGYLGRRLVSQDQAE